MWAYPHRNLEDFMVLKLVWCIHFAVRDVFSGVSGSNSLLNGEVGSN